MGIAALPDQTVRAIGASQVLTDPSALVKELVDNALDAHTTSLSVEIHHNTLDVIQVRDNGHGIAPEDRPLVAKRYCTSKLSSYDDLKDIGGSSLGFRGEALASAAELSGSLTISTRIEGEQIGAALKISQQGKVIDQDRASLPVGTCVKITDFIKANPVRRQVNLKSADACLKKIKRCLQAYAFARPHVRYSLRVVKAKTPKGDWVYAPKPNGNAEDAAIKLVGSACASQCLWSTLEHEGFSFQAFLPKPGADASKIGGFGSFISVDARPVSSARGHFKQVCKAYREALKGAGSQFEDVKEPFLYLEISCPDESYDVNVEPAKDDVAFEDAYKVVEGLKKLFVAVYAASQTFQTETVANVTPDQHQEVATGEMVQDAQLIPEAHRPILMPQMAAADVDPTDHSMMRGNANQPSLTEYRIEEQASPAPRRTFRTNMYGCDEEDLDFLGAQLPEDESLATLEELRQASKDVTVSNPWVLAKMNSSIRRPGMEQLRESSPTVNSWPCKRPRLILDEEEAGLPTPRPSSPSPPAEAFHPSDHVPHVRMARNDNTMGVPRLPPPQMSSPWPSSDILEPDDLNMVHVDRRPNVGYNYGLSPQVHDLPTSTPLEGIPDLSARTRRSPRKQDQQSRVNKPFVPPLKDRPPQEKVWFDHLENIERRPRHWSPARGQTANHNLVMQGELGDLMEDGRPLTPPRRNRDIRDFVGLNTDTVSAVIEARNYPRPANRDPHTDQENNVDDVHVPRKNGNLARHGFVRASEVANMNEEFDSPEKQAPALRKRRKTSERTVLRDLNANAPLAREETEEDQEYRPTTTGGTLSRRRSSHKIGRNKSSNLPLERTPASQRTQNLLLNTSVSIARISQFAGKIDEEQSLLGFNEPALDPDDVFGANPPDLRALAAYLHGLLLRAGGDSPDIPTARPDHLFRELESAFAKHSASEDGDEVMSLN